MIQPGKNVRQREYGVLILSYSNSWFVALAEQIASFEQVEPPQAGGGSGKPGSLDLSVDLGDYLTESHQASGTHVSTKCLSVQSGEHHVIFNLADKPYLTGLGEDRFFLLPAVLRDAGCDAWVRGVALLDSSFKKEQSSELIPAIWIDLKRLAATVLKHKGLCK